MPSKSVATRFGEVCAERSEWLIKNMMNSFFVIKQRVYSKNTSKIIPSYKDSSFVKANLIIFSIDFEGLELNNPVALFANTVLKLMTS